MLRELEGNKGWRAQVTIPPSYELKVDLTLRITQIKAFSVQRIGGLK
jgi:hypothetical protein